MYNAAICDDDGIFVSYMRRIVTQAAGSEFGELRISEFTQGEVFVSSLEGGAKYDLLILDMELGKMDGDQVAQIFRKKNRDAVLVFCSGVRAPSVKSFKATPFRYLLKTYTDEQIINEMQEILEEVNSRSSEEIVELLKELCKTYHKTIIMVTHNNDITKNANKVIHITDGKIDQVTAS